MNAKNFVLYFQAVDGLLKACAGVAGAFEDTETFHVVMEYRAALNLLEAQRAEVWALHRGLINATDKAAAIIAYGRGVSALCDDIEGLTFIFSNAGEWIFRPPFAPALDALWLAQAEVVAAARELGDLAGVRLSNLSNPEAKG